MRIAIRADSGPNVGYGHIRRCTTLADALRAHGADVDFVETDDFDADALVADSYKLDAAWFSAMRARTKLLVIDDLADRVIDADLITNSSITTLPYRTGAGTRLLLGPLYALTRRAFRDAAHATRFEVEHVLVTLGGSDPQFRTRAVVATLQTSLGESVHIDVIVGPYGDDATLYEIAARDSRITLHRNVTDLAPFMARADLAISGGGQTTFELAAAGLPAVAIAVADNQRHVLAGFAEAGTLIDAGDDLHGAVVRAITDAQLRKRMSDAGRKLVDGAGADRVAAALMSQIRS